MSGKAKYWLKLNNALDVPEKVIDAARGVELIVMDVDGVLTDGHTYQLDNGEQFLCFSVQDSLAFYLCEAVGLGLAVISGRDIQAARIRMGRFPIQEMHFGCARKEPVLVEMSRRLEIPLSRMAYIGDDLIDLPLLMQVGFPIAVSNAAPEVLEAALYRTSKAGGHGAVREVIDLVLKAKGLYEQAVTKYLREH
ncbi:MAG TPA: HAD hydrolase family protein [archaeon]|nr:HAD hydrolase family protein [archaeon]